MKICDMTLIHPMRLPNGSNNTWVQSRVNTRAPWDIDLDLTTGIVRVSGHGKEFFTHRNNIRDWTLAEHGAVAEPEARPEPTKKLEAKR